MLHHFASTLPSGQPIVATQSDTLPSFGTVVWMECPTMEIAASEAVKLNALEEYSEVARCARIMAASAYAGRVGFPTKPPIKRGSLEQPPVKRVTAVMGLLG